MHCRGMIGLALLLYGNAPFPNSCLVCGLAIATPCVKPTCFQLRSHEHARFYWRACTRHPYNHRRNRSTYASVCFLVLGTGSTGCKSRNLEMLRRAEISTCYSIFAGVEALQRPLVSSNLNLCLCTRLRC